MTRWVGTAVVLAAACVPHGGPANNAGVPPELGSSLNVRVAGDSVHLEMHITNTTTGPLSLEFATGQRYDFEVARYGGETVWRWSEGMAFTQALGREVLEAGESRRYTAAWSAAGRTGDMVATGRLTSMNHPVELQASFRVPAD